METRRQKAKKERELSTGARPSSFTGSDIVPVQPKHEHSQVPAPSGGPSFVVWRHFSYGSDFQVLYTTDHRPF